VSVKLTDEQMEKIFPILTTFPEIILGLPRQSRRFLEAVFRITRSGAQWRLPPAEYGNCNTVYKRFARWSQLGVFEKLFEQISADRDLEYLLIDSTIVRSHTCAPERKKSGQTIFRQKSRRTFNQDSFGD
jgi:transposase